MEYPVESGLLSAGTHVTSRYAHVTSLYADGISRYSVPASAGSRLPLVVTLVRLGAERSSVRKSQTGVPWCVDIDNLTPGRLEVESFFRGQLGLRQKNCIQSSINVP